MTSPKLPSFASPTAAQQALLAAGTDPQQYLTFYVGEEMFAMGILAIREIIEYHALTEVPLVPPLIRGVINLRGSVVPVVDLAVRFERTPRPSSKRTCIVVVETQHHDAALENTSPQKMGVVVDAVSEVLEIAPQAIEPAPEFGTHLRSDFIQGMAHIRQQFIVVLDIDRILWLPEIAVRSSLQTE